ncbi:MAG: hypothetical protein AAF267_05970 [Deinococcota bacterium]
MIYPDLQVGQDKLTRLHREAQTEQLIRQMHASFRTVYTAALSIGLTRYNHHNDTSNNAADDDKQDITEQAQETTYAWKL